MRTRSSSKERMGAEMKAIVARAKRDDGFTLIELLVGIVILGMVLGAIANALIVGLTTTNDTSQRFSESHDAQIASAYLAKDVQSALSITNATTPSCGSGALIGFSLDGGKQVSYYYGPGSGGETQVTRRSCDGSGAQVLAHFAGSGTPEVTCDAVSCDPSARPKPNVVKISITEVSGYSFTLLGARRITTANGAGAQSTPPLTMLASGNSPLWIAGGCPPGQIKKETDECIIDPDTPNSSDQPSLTVNGNLFVNSTASNAVRLTGKKNVTKLTVTSPGGFGILTPGGCTGCTPNTVTCLACVWAGNQPWTGYSPEIPDPLRFMADPTSSVTGSCGGGVCQPGVYASKLQITSSTTLNSGIYILRNGMSLTGNSALTGSGVMLFVAGGDVNLAGGSTINLTPPTSGPYKNVLIFQARSNPSALKITGGSSSDLTFGGVIYVPASIQVTLSTGGATLRVTAVIAQNIKVASNAQAIIG